MNEYHWHRHYELLIVRQGSYILTNNRKTIQSSGPAIFLHRPLTLHIMNCDPQTTYVRRIVHIRRDVVNRFTPEAVDSALFFNANLIYAVPNSTEWQEIDTYIEQIDRQTHDEVAAALLSALLIRCIMQIAQNGRGEIASCYFSYIQGAIAYIADHLSESCSIESISQKFDVKRSKFQSDFKKETGMPYHRYLVNLRMVRAQELLLAGKSVQDTSLEVGYSSESHFIKEFTKYCGTTPGTFLAKHTESF